MCENRIKPDFWKTFLIPHKNLHIVGMLGRFSTNNKISKIALLISLLGCCYPVFLMHLNEPVIHLWDEASYAHNALQMLKHKNPLVVYAFDQPDLYNTKPPLVIWLMAASIKLLGWNELAVRLPAALAGIGCVWLVFAWLNKATQNMFTAFCGALVLMSSYAFTGWHIARTGDTDVWLAFFLLSGVYQCWLYTVSKQNTHWYLFVLSIAAACLSKGISGLLPLPGCLAFMFHQNRFNALPPLKHLLMGLLLWIVLVPGYYLVRESMQSGFLAMVWQNEVGGRLHTQTFINPQGNLPAYVYLKAMITENRYLLWIWILPVALISLLIKRANRAGLMAIYCALSILAIISLSKTKLPWYDAPLYPFFALIIALALDEWSKQIRLLPWFLVILSIYPFYQIIHRNLHPVDEFNFPQALHYFRQNKQVKEKMVVYERHMLYPIHFYLTRDSIEGYRSAMVSPAEARLKENDWVMTLTEERKKELQDVYHTELSGSYYNCTLHRITGIQHD